MSRGNKLQRKYCPRCERVFTEEFNISAKKKPDSSDVVEKMADMLARNTPPDWPTAVFPDELRNRKHGLTTTIRLFDYEIEWLIAIIHDEWMTHTPDWSTWRYTCDVAELGLMEYLENKSDDLWSAKKRMRVREPAPTMGYFFKKSNIEKKDIINREPS